MTKFKASIAHLPHMFTGLALVVIFSRLVPPVQFSEFVLAFAFINIAGGISFGWVQVAALRFSLKAYGNDFTLLSRLLFGFSISLPILVVLAFGFYFTGLISHVGAPLFAAASYGVSVLFAQMCRGKNDVGGYAQIGLIRLLSILPLAFALTQVEDTANSLLIALGAGSLLAALISLVFTIKGERVSISAESEPVATPNLRELLTFGLPASASLMGVMLLLHSDRLVLRFFVEPNIIAWYVIQADLARQAIYPIASALSIGILPAALVVAREKDEAAAHEHIREQAERTLILLMMVVGVMVVAGADIINIIMPAGYARADQGVISLITISTFLVAARMVRLDMGFQLQKRTSAIATSTLAAVTLFLVLSPLLASQFGVLGVATSAPIAAASSLLVLALKDSSGGNSLKDVVILIILVCLLASAAWLNSLINSQLELATAAKWVGGGVCLLLVLFIWRMCRAATGE